MEDEEQYITFMPVECPACGKIVFVLGEDGEQDFECDCGFKDVLRIESVK